MKFLFSLFFLCCTLSTVFANESYIANINTGNVHLQYVINNRDAEIKNKLTVLTNLVNKLCKQSGYSSDDLYILFVQDDNVVDSPSFILGYGSFLNSIVDTEAELKKTSVGLNLYIRDADFDIKEVLNIVNESYKNLEYIKREQKEVHVNFRSVSTLYSINSSKIKSFRFSSDRLVDNILSEKVYRNVFPTTNIGEIDYYYLNRKIHFYNTWEQNALLSKELQKASEVMDTMQGLVLDNVKDIVGSSMDGYFIFINDSVFYYVNYARSILVGPLEIEHVQRNRFDLIKYTAVLLPINRFEIVYNNDEGYTSKALFFPDSNVVVSCFEKLEDSLIVQLFSKNDKMTTIEEDGFDVWVVYLLAGVLIISLLVNVNQWRG